MNLVAGPAGPLVVAVTELGSKATARHPSPHPHPHSTTVLRPPVSAAGFPYTISAILLVCAAVCAVALWRRWSPPVLVTVLIALVIRAAVVALSYGHTPSDVAVYFQRAGQLVLAHRNPATALPHFQWNFLPLMPFGYALEIRTGLPWEIGGKIIPVLGDLAVVALLARLAPPRASRTLPLLYALCPLAILVSALHGQVEPVALALGLAALLLARRGASLGAGAVLGLAIATKTWPVLLVVGVLPESPARRWWRLATGAGIVLAALLLSVRLLHDSVHAMLHALASYRSFTGLWGWTGILRYFHIAGIGYSGPHVDPYQRLGTVLMVVALLTAVLVFRRAGSVGLTAALLLTFLAITAGFGPQYLLWSVPFVLLLRRPTGLLFVLVASAYAAFDYLIVIPATHNTGALGTMHTLQQWLSVPVIVSALAALPWHLRRKDGNPQANLAVNPKVASASVPESDFDHAVGRVHVHLPAPSRVNRR